jgi:shikimate dehydrogenase
LLSQKFKNFIQNDIEISQDEKFTAIIGSNPSKGARSPILWNRAFKNLNLNVKMFPFDVKIENLANLLLSLQENQNFLGGAIAAPYKEYIFEFLSDNFDREVSLIKSVNSLSRDQKNNFFGHNTDGKASVDVFKKEFGSIKAKKVLIMGYGGVGKSVASYFSSEIGKDGQLTIITSKDLKKFNSSLSLNIIFKNWIDLETVIKEVDIIINCTTLGWDKYIDISPLEENSFKYLNKETIVYDVIYQPIETRFLKYAKKYELRYMNGEKMNFLQAVLGFCNTVKFYKNVSQYDVEKSMIV